jgi:hypothetical protein
MSVDPPIPAVASCRHCGRDVSHLPPSAGYCPFCGGALAPTGIDAFKLRVRAIRAALSLARRRAHARPAAYDGKPDRSKIITGYGNAMFKLGWRYEVHRNLPEAIRCYFKSSKLGNADAQTRLEPAQHKVDAQPPPEPPPVPAFRLWRDWDAAYETVEQRVARDIAAVEARAYAWLSDKRELRIDEKDPKLPEA